MCGYTDTDEMCENRLNSQDVVSNDDSDDGDMFSMRRRLRRVTVPLMETTYFDEVLLQNHYGTISVLFHGLLCCFCY